MILSMSLFQQKKRRCSWQKKLYEQRCGKVQVAFESGGTLVGCEPQKSGTEKGGLGELIVANETKSKYYRWAVTVQEGRIRYLDFICGAEQKLLGLYILTEF